MSQRQIGGTNFMIPEPVLKYTQGAQSGGTSSSTGLEKSSSKTGHGHKSNPAATGTTEPSSKKQKHPAVTLGTADSRPRPAPKSTVQTLVAQPRPLWFVGRCTHFESFKKSPQLRSYIKAHCILVFPQTIKERGLKAILGRCSICATPINSHVCLKCFFCGCLKGGHFQSHFLDTGHDLALNLSNGSIYCYNCCEIVRDIDLSRPPRSQPVEMKRIPPVHRKSKAAGIYRRLFTKPSFTSSKSILGLRGLINLGHTCFMSSIVQALIHTPILRDFFLSSEIKCAEKHDVGRRKPCIVSLVADLYQQFYSGMKTAMSLHELLHKIWANAAHLAGYEQQDAHEFFIAMLDALHLHFHAPDQLGTCNCVIDVIFLGKLESAVTCINCGHKSITVDPFWDTSLDLMTDDPGVTLTLSDCLTRYTRIEHLGSTGKIWCTLCGSNQESTKQLKFKTLPMVLCLHLKRFEHRTSYKKIDTRVEFPEYLRMDDYRSTATALIKEDNGTLALVSQVRQISSRYILYAVVNHVGSLEGGHYYAYIQHAGGTWYKCDDHWITIVDKSEVLASPGYLLFYHKEVLSHSNPTARFP